MADRILVTGATGFVGSRLVPALEALGHDVIAAVRHASGPSSSRTIAVGPIEDHPDWKPALDGVGTVIHLANATPGRQSDAAYHRINAEGTRHLSEQAIDCGVGRFVYLSSSHASPDFAESAYGLSKRNAEEHAAAFASDNRQAISLRVPLVYGANAKGNWRLLQRLAATGVPLPFASLKAQRSLISRENLVDALCHLGAMQTWPSSGTFDLADAETVDLSQIMRLLREGMNRPSRLFAFPPGLMHLSARYALGREKADGFLTGVAIDSSKFTQNFGWSAPESAPDAIRRCGREFAATRQ